MYNRSCLFQLGVMDTDVSRNFFGRQVNSFEAEVKLSDSFIKVCPGETSFHGVFIRAPAVVQTFSPKVEVLASLTREEISEPVIVAVQQSNVIATAFHPELTEDVRWHQYFLERVLRNKSDNEWWNSPFSLKISRSWPIWIATASQGLLLRISIISLLLIREEREEFIDLWF